MLEPALITARVTALLEKLHVRYLIGGSLASTLHSMVRTTQDSDIAAEQLSRVQQQILSIEPPAEAFVAPSEDTLLSKLEWYRLGGEVSERQWRDVLEILEVQGESLDFDYMHQWAKELIVSDLLDRALREGCSKFSHPVPGLGISKAQ